MNWMYLVCDKCGFSGSYSILQLRFRTVNGKQVKLCELCAKDLDNGIKYEDIKRISV